MFYYLLYPFKDEFPFLRIFGYVTFRTLFAAITAMVIVFYIGPKFFRYMKNIDFKENIRDDGPQSHHSKAGTPTMGGILMLISLTISVLLWGNLGNAYVLIILVSTILLGLVGFSDDYSKAMKKRKYGMSARTKFILQNIIALVFSLLIYNFSSAETIQTFIYIPFLKDPVLDLGIFIIPFWVFIITGFSNAVNLTDGLDGLASGLSMIAMTALSVFAYLTGISSIARYLLIPFIPEVNELAIFLAAFIGSGVAFLWYNSYPAQVFMGDTGSLALGGAIAMSAIMVKRELLLVILGGIFVAETVSVILQVGSFKLRKKRIFKMAPVHHHFELSGWHENKVVVRFWIIGVLLAIISLSSLKII